jgi:hypothetical protein
VAVCNSVLLACGANKVVYPDHFDLRGGMSSLGPRLGLQNLASAPFKRLIHEVLVLFQFFPQNVDFVLLLLKPLVELVSKPSFCLLLGLLKAKFKFAGLLFQVVNLFLEDFNVQFKLLLDAHVFAHFCFGCLQLLLIFFWREVQRLERTREVGLRVVPLVAVVPLAVCLLLLLVFKVHKDLN